MVDRWAEINWILVLIVLKSNCNLIANINKNNGKAIQICCLCRAIFPN